MGTLQEVACRGLHGLGLHPDAGLPRKTCKCCLETGKSCSMFPKHCSKERKNTSISLFVTAGGQLNCFSLTWVGKKDC